MDQGALTGRNIGLFPCHGRESMDLGRAFTKLDNWWRWRDSNPRPSDYDSPALPTELHRLDEKNMERTAVRKL